MLKTAPNRLSGTKNRLDSVVDRRAPDHILFTFLTRRTCQEKRASIYKLYPHYPLLIVNNLP
jgi:hypothetical protein